MEIKVDYKLYLGNYTTLAKEHLLETVFIISAIIQLAILFFFYFPTGVSSTSIAIPMTILPYSEEIIQPAKKEVKKEVEVTEELDKAEIKEEKKIETKISAQNLNKMPLFLPFVRVDQIAKSRNSLLPDYPDSARNAGIEGTVVLEVYIDKRGKVRDVIVKKGIGFGCDQAAINKLKSTVFIPAKMGGKAVAVRQIISFDFRLN